MLKKLTLLALSVVALLALAASAAQASGPLLTDSQGGTTNVGTITAESTNTKLVTPLGTLECYTVNLHGTVKTNSNTTVEGSGTGTAEGTVPAKKHTGECGSGVGKVLFNAVTASRFHLTRHGSPVATTGVIDLSFTFTVTTIFGDMHCTLSGTGAAVTKTGASTIKVSGNLVRVAPSPGALCPDQGTITGDFTVRDKLGGFVTIH